MRRVLAVAWMVVAGLALAALVHLADPGVRITGGLATSRVVPTLALLTALFAGLQAPAVAAWVRGRRGACAIAIATVAVMLGLGLAAAGIGAATPWGFGSSVLLGATVSAVILAVGVVPAGVLLRRNA